MSILEETRKAYAEQLKLAHGVGHYDGCWKDHWPCVLERLLGKIERMQSNFDALSKWRPIETAPEGIMVRTTIIEDGQPRNTTSLIRKDSLWFLPDMNPVYYTPTHWMSLEEAGKKSATTLQQKIEWLREIDAIIKGHLSQNMSATVTISRQERSFLGEIADYLERVKSAHWHWVLACPHDCRACDNLHQILIGK